MTTQTWTRYELSLKGSTSSFSPDGRKTSWTKTYTHEDCLNHIKELREHVYNGKKIYADSEFQISTITEVKTTCPVS